MGWACLAHCVSCVLVAPFLATVLAVPRRWEVHFPYDGGLPFVFSRKSQLAPWKPTLGCWASRKRWRFVPAAVLPCSHCPAVSLSPVRAALFVWRVALPWVVYRHICDSDGVNLLWPHISLCSSRDASTVCHLNSPLSPMARTYLSKCSVRAFKNKEGAFFFQRKQNTPINTFRWFLR